MRILENTAPPLYDDHTNDFLRTETTETKLERELHVFAETIFDQLMTDVTGTLKSPQTEHPIAN